MVDDYITFLATITNHSPADAIGVTLTDILPAGLTHAGTIPSQGTCDATITCQLGDLAAGESVTVQIMIEVTRAGDITNTASVSGNQPDPNPANNSASATVRVNADNTNHPPVAVDDPVEAGCGAPVVIRVLDNDYDPDGDPLTIFFVGNFTGGHAIFNADNTITFYPDSCDVLGGFSYKISDGRGGTDFAWVIINIRQSDGSNTADLALTKGGSGYAVVGDYLTFLVTVTNSGPTQATGVVLIDMLSAGLRLESVIPSQGTCDTAIICQLGNLAVGDSVTVQIIVEVTHAGDIINTANVSGNQPDPNSANNSASATVHVSHDNSNRPPVAVDDETETACSTPVIINVLANDYDPDGDPLTIFFVGNFTGGHAIFNEDNTITFSPGACDMTGGFSYKINDDKGGVDFASVTVVVNPGTELPETSVEEVSEQPPVTEIPQDDHQDELEDT